MPSRGNRNRAGISNGSIGESLVRFNRGVLITNPFHQDGGTKNIDLGSDARGIRCMIADDWQRPGRAHLAGVDPAPDAETPRCARLAAFSNDRRRTSLASRGNHSIVAAQPTPPHRVPRQ